MAQRPVQDALLIQDAQLHNNSPRNYRLNPFVEKVLSEVGCLLVSGIVAGTIAASLGRMLPCC